MAEKTMQTRRSSGGTPTAVRETAKIAAQMRTDLGFQPEPVEVADLIEQALSEGLVPALSLDTANSLVAVLRGPDHANPDDAVIGAYAELCRWLRSGPSAKVADVFLAAIYEPTAVIEFRAFSDTQSPIAQHYRQGTDDVSRATWINQQIGTRNIYFGISPRLDDRAGKSQASKNEHVKLRRNIVLDFDNKDASETDPDWTRTLGALQRLAPIALVNSGNGWHIWFRIEEITGPDVQTCQGLLDQGMAAIGADTIADAARIIRLPGAINIPNKAKRERGNRLALARLAQPLNPDAKVWPAADLVAALEGVAQDLGLPGRKSKAGSGSCVRVAIDNPAKLNAPDFWILKRVLELLPNGTSFSHYDRNKYQVPIAHAARGSALGTAFEQEARDAFLEWCGKFGGDPVSDLKLYDSTYNTHTGFDALLAILRKENPQGYAEIEPQLTAHVNRQAKLAFEGAELDPDQAHLVEQPVNMGGLEPAKTVDQKRVAEGFDETVGKGRENVAERALNLLKASGAEIFPDHKGGTWIKLAGAVMSVDSDMGFRGVLGWLAKERGTRLIGPQKKNLQDLIQSEVHGQEARTVHFRVLQGADCVHINLMRQPGDMVVVTSVGWRVQPVSAAPEPMANRVGALPLPMPERVTDGVGLFERLNRHIRLDPIQRPNDPHDSGVQQRAMLAAFLLSQFWRPGGVPHLLLSAEQGSGKTTSARRLKGLTDPDTAGAVPSTPNDEKDFYAIAGQQCSLILDNLSGMRRDLSDIFCGLATGSAFQKRALHTNGERAIFEAKTSLIFTTIIDDLIKREDLMDRTYPLTLPPLDDKDRRSETDLEAAWKADQELLLAGLLDMLVGALAQLPKLDAQRAAGLIPHPPRMADAANIAEAAMQAIGWQPGICTGALAVVKRGSNDDLLESNPLAVRVREFINAQPGQRWVGTPTQLQGQLRHIQGPDWENFRPTISAVSRALKRAAKSMREGWGIDVVFHRSSRQRTIEISTFSKRDASPK